MSCENDDKRSSNNHLWFYYNATLLHTSQGLFPFAVVYAMLTMGAEDGEDGASRRVLSIQSPGDSNVYKQKQYPRATLDMFRFTTCKRLPQSIHMGQLVGRKELVFDIDVTDFRRFCQCERRFCSLCWLHIEGAYLVLRHLLETRLAFSPSNMLWVFSGGKGFHCFVNSVRVLSLTGAERERLHAALSIDPRTNGEWEERLCRLIDELTRHYSDFVIELERHFASAVLHRRNALRESPALEQFCLETLTLRRFAAFYLPVKKAWQGEDDDEEARPTKRPRFLVSSDTTRNSSEKKWSLLCRFEDEIRPLVRPSLFIVLLLFYPQIDAGPMRLDHAIKLPFSINARTQAIALPVRRDALLTFDPEREALTLAELVTQATRYGSRVPGAFTDGARLLQEWNAHYNK